MKAYGHQAYRRRLHQLLDTLPASTKGDFLDDKVDPGTVVREEVRKWPVAPMGEVVRKRLEARAVKTAWNFFKRPYNSSPDQRRFSRFLASQLEGHSDHSQELALLFQKALLGPVNAERSAGPQFGVPNWEMYQDWLYAFFKDEPEWEVRLRTWIASFEQE